MKQFGIRVKEARIAAKMTQDELARKVGYTTRSSIAKIEKGETDISTKRISRIAKALGVEESWLNSLVEASEKELPKVLVERIEINNRQAKIVSTLGRLLGEVGCGGSIERLPIIFLYFAFNLDI